MKWSLWCSDMQWCLIPITFDLLVKVVELLLCYIMWFMVSFNVQPILPGGRDRERERYHNFFSGEKRSNCLYRALSAPSLSFLCEIFCLSWICLSSIEKSFNWRHLSCLNYRSGLCGPLSRRVSWSSLQPPGCEATTWEIEGALAEWIGTEFIQFLYLVITFVAFRWSLQMYFRSQYDSTADIFCTHRVCS